MDCSWGYGLNKACDGGDYDAAFDYLKLAGGPIQEKDYEYLGADAFCRDKNFSSSQKATFKVRPRQASCLQSCRLESQSCNATFVCILSSSAHVSWVSSRGF